jgi:hypothetical protein
MTQCDALHIFVDGMGVSHPWNLQALEDAMKKVAITTSAVAAALLFTLATGLATVPSADTVLGFFLGHQGTLLPLW